MTNLLKFAVLFVFASSAHAQQSVSPPAPRPPGIPVDVINRSEPVLCAEKDNVAIALAATNVRAFRIEAAHPPYIGMIQRDGTAILLGHLANIGTIVYFGILIGGGGMAAHGLLRHFTG